MNLTNIDKPLRLGERHIFFKIVKLLKTVAAKDTDRMVGTGEAEQNGTGEAEQKA